MCIAIFCFPGCNVINLEIFLIQPFFYLTKKSRQKYIVNEKSFLGEIKRIFIILKGLSVAKNCLRPDSTPLRPAMKSNLGGSLQKIQAEFEWL